MVERFRRFIARHPRGFDAAVAIFWSLASIGTDGVFDNTKTISIFFTVTAIMGVALYWRRQYALAVWAVHAVIIIASIFIDIDAEIPIAAAAGAYALGAYARDRQRSVVAFFGVLATGIFCVLITEPSTILDAVPVVLVLLVGWVIGDSLRTQRAYQQSVLERAERAEALRDSLAQRAVSDERTRIARELHDVVAHSMSLMVVQAGAARRVVHTDAGAAEEALRAIESVGRNSLDEMRRILDVLRSEDDPAATAPQPDIASLDSLVDEFRAAGLRVELVTTGDQRELGTPIELTAYRIVQESLTNVLKHARADAVTVTIEYHHDRLELSISDDGVGAGADSLASGSQRGLVGMRERVAAFGGEFEAGPRLGGGYRVTATLPTTTATAIEASTS